MNGMKSILARFISAGVIAALALGLLQAGIPSARAAGVVDLTALGAAYTQDFNTLAITGLTNTLLPDGWELSEAGSSSANNGTYRGGTGSDNTGDTYSFGLAGSTERAFGGLLSGTLTPTIGAQIANNTGGVITALEISYTGEQWRYGAANRPADRIDFQFSTDASSLSSGAWTDVDGLDFISPVTSGTVGALNGNVDPNRTALSATIDGLNILPGAVFWIRWTDFNVTSSDDGLAVDDFSITPQGYIAPEDTAPSVTGSYPADGAATFPVSDALTVTFSEPVNVADGWFDLTCSTSGTLSAAVSGGPTTFTIDPDVDLVNGETCTLTVFAAGVTDQDLIDPPDNLEINFTAGFTAYDVCAQPYTPIYSIQGNGANAAITGTLTTKGVVVGDFEGASPALNGFFLQDLSGDGDPATSDGIFVFGGNPDRVNLGDVVLVTGAASDYQGQTQVSLSSFVACGSGSVEPLDIDFPVPSADYLERYEGMLVRVPETMTVTEMYLLGRFGQVTLSADGRLQQPTNVVTPGAEALALQEANNLRKIVLDDMVNNQNPEVILFGRGGQPLSSTNTLRGGDTITGLVGILTYTWGGNSASPNAYRIRPVSAAAGGYDFQPANPRPTAAPEVGGEVRVVGMNTLNFYNTFNGCTNGVGGASTDCRGAENQTEFDRQWVKTVAGIVTMNPDVVGVNEVENDGYGPDSALAFLVDKLNEATAPGTYALVDVDAQTGQVNAMGTDGIKVGLIYKPAVVSLAGQTVALNSAAFVNGGDGSARNRPALIQAFEQVSTGERFVVVVNHLKSKGSACDAPDTGDGQGNCNTVRVNAVTELLNVLASDPTGTGDPDTLIIGDQNSYAKEDPITTLVNAGYTNLIESFLGPDAYSYVFDGQWGYLDHALGSASIVSQVTGVADFHINSDEPSVFDYNTNFKGAGQLALYAPDMYRISDHDPVVIGLHLNTPPQISAGGPYTVEEGGVVTLSAVVEDRNLASVAWDLDNNGSFETPGQDVTFSAALLDGPTTVTVQVQAIDSDGATTTASAEIMVTNAAPVLGPISAAAGPFKVGDPVSVSASFSDPGVADTHSAAIDWGDGSSSAGAVSEAGGAGTVSGEHTYAAAGFYTVTMTVTDDDGAVSGVSVSETVVVYDPNGGAITGGGWFYWQGSKTTVSFTARYHDGAFNPKGNARLQVKAADLKFNALSTFDWLVVTGSQAVLRGQGTNNDQMAPNGSYYQFILYVDDTTDSVRMVVWWDEVVGGATVQHVVFDNGAMQMINGGSVQVH